MGRYDHLKQIAAPLFVKMEPVSEEKIRNLINHCNPPLDYLDFLGEIGFGEILKAEMVYEGLISPSDIFDPESASQMKGILLWGDDMGENCYGFDTGNQWKVVMVSCEDFEPDALADTFEDYIVESINTALSYE